MFSFKFTLNSEKTTAKLSAHEPCVLPQSRFLKQFFLNNNSSHGFFSRPLKTILTFVIMWYNYSKRMVNYELYPRVPRNETKVRPPRNSRDNLAWDKSTRTK